MRKTINSERSDNGRLVHFVGIQLHYSPASAIMEKQATQVPSRSKHD